MHIPDAPPAGRPRELEPGLVTVLAPNASAMTYWGTNTYLLGQGALAVIDPGPDDPAHLAALLAAIGDRPVSHILVTHAHTDHSPLAPVLAARVGAPVLAFGPADAGQSAVMRRLAADGLTGGGEGVDARFAPDISLADGAVITGEGWQITALHTPGHMGNHLCFDWQGRVFTGDHVMGWASSLVSPPDGDLTQFMASCATLAGRGAKIFHPGHGAPVTDPAGRLEWLIGHRRARESQILAALDAGPADVAELTARVYTDVAPHMWPMARRNVFAHLVDLAGRGRVLARPALAIDAEFSLA